MRQLTRSGRSARGFTLIELLVVIFIISIVTSVALLSISHNSNKQLESFAKELTQMVTLAEEQAMLSPNVLGLAFEQRTFYFASLQPAVNNKKKTWIRLQDSLFGKRVIPDPIQVDVVVDGVRIGLSDSAENKKNPQIVISTNGDITPFKIYIGKRGDKPRYVVTGDADGTVVSKALS